MADKKISQLTAATTPLAGTEVLPIVQGGSTVKVSAADITAGRAISSSSLTTGTTDIFAKVGTQLSGGNAILSRFNATNKPAGIYTGGSSGESFFGANLDWSSGNVFNYKLNGLMWYIGDPGGSGASVSLGVASGTAGNSALVDTGGNVKFQWDTSGNYKIENGNLVVGTANKGIADSAGNLKLAVTTTSVAASSVLSGGLTHRKGTYTPGDTTPSVSGVSYLDINNSSATSITNFTGAVEGQMLMLVFRNANTTITRNNAYLAGSVNFTSANNATLLLISDGTAWYEVCRSTTNG